MARCLVNRLVISTRLPLASLEGPCAQAAIQFLMKTPPGNYRICIRLFSALPRNTFCSLPIEKLVFEYVFKAAWYWGRYDSYQVAEAVVEDQVVMVTRKSSSSGARPVI